MMITTRNETFFKVEMTATQADFLCQFFNFLTAHEIDTTCQRGKVSMPDRDDMTDAIRELQHVLQRRNGT